MSKKSLVISVLALMIAAALLTMLAPAYSLARSPQSTDASINTFWNKFKAAVISGDKNAVAAMSQFPIDMTYGNTPVRNRSQLIKRYREIFNTETDAPKCFRESKPVIDATNRNRFEVGCKDSAGNEVVVYGFVRTRTGWKFNSLDNINE